MKRSIWTDRRSVGRRPNAYFRLVIVVLVASMSVLLFSYVRARSNKPQEPCSDSGKCNGENHGSKAKSEIILLESLTHNFLVSNK